MCAPGPSDLPARLSLAITMSNEQIETERRWGRIAAGVGLVGVFFYVMSGFVGGTDYNGAEGIAEQIAALPDEKSSVLLQLVLQAIGVSFFSAPLVALFLAASARSDAVRKGLLGVNIAGPLFFGASLIALYFALDATIDPFLNGSGVDLTSDDQARDILHEQSAYGIYAGLDLAGRLGLVFGMVYTALQCLRAGLMTRFWGTLSMALGAASIIIGPAALLVYVLAANLLVGDVWPGGRPPAWAKGEAMPWPNPNAPPPEPEPEEAANPEDFEGSATEVTPSRPARRDNKRKRKRKQR